MRTLLTILLIIGFGISLIAQDQAKKSLLELEQKIYEKKFSKKWEKEKKSDWEKQCNEASSIETLNSLFNQYSDLMAQTNGFSMGNSDATTEVEFLEYLLKVEGTILAEYSTNWSAEDRELWKNTISEFIKKEEEKKAKMDQMARFQKMSAIVKDFGDKFPQLWEDSKKNAFANTAQTTIKGGSEFAVTKDSYGVASYQVFFDTEGDLAMAKKLVDELVVIILEKAGDGYKRGNEMDPSYTDSMKQVYQFEGAKFAETAKRPTVSIGVIKDKAGVQIIITEPVFGH